MKGHFGLVYLLLLITFFRLTSSLTYEEKEKIRQIIRHTMDCRDLPGIIVSVIDQNRIDMTEGFGFLDLNSTNNVVNDSTRFGIGSLSKAFTAALLSKVIANSAFNMDTLIKEIIPDINLGNEINTNRATIRDILSHKLGYLGYGPSWMVGLDLDKDRQEYCERLGHLKSVGFRKEFKYSNYMFVLASCIVERLTGKKFEEALQEHIFNPLNMFESDSISNLDNWDWKKFASPHSYDIIEKKTKRIDRENIKTVTPGEGSGGVFSTAKNMANWMLMNLNNGLFNGRRIFEEDSIKEMHSPQFSADNIQMIIRKPFFPIEDFKTSYGFGWYIGTYGGYRQSSHPGSIAGFNSMLYLFPDIKSGVFVSGNSFTMHESVLALIYYISDILQGREPFINSTTACTFPQPWIENLPFQGDKMRSVSEAPPVSKPVETNKLKGSIEKYVGSYGHPFFGNLTIWFDENIQGLMAKTGNLGYAKLFPTDDETIFDVKLTGPVAYVERSPYFSNASTPIRFQSEVDGKYQEIFNWFWEPQDPPTYKRGLLWND